MKAKIVYSEYTNTFRLMPQNYWLASVKNKKLIFDSWDGATKEILKNNLSLKIKIIICYLKLLMKK